VFPPGPSPQAVVTVPLEVKAVRPEAIGEGNPVVAPGVIGEGNAAVHPAVRVATNREVRGEGEAEGRAATNLEARPEVRGEIEDRRTIPSDPRKKTPSGG